MTQQNKAPTHCENCTMELSVCDCVEQKPVRYNVSPSASAQPCPECGNPRCFFGYEGAPCAAPAPSASPASAQQDSEPRCDVCGAKTTDPWLDHRGCQQLASAQQDERGALRYYPDFDAGIMRESAHGAWVRYAAQQVQAEGEAPLFWYRPCQDGLYEGPHHANSVGGKMLRDEKPDEWKPLYTHPSPATEGASTGALTDAQIFEMWDQVHAKTKRMPIAANQYRQQVINFARALLASPAKENSNG